MTGTTRPQSHSKSIILIKGDIKINVSWCGYKDGDDGGGDGNDDDDYHGGNDDGDEKDHLVGVLHVVVVMLAARARFLKKRSLNVDKQGKGNNCQAYKNTKGHLV